jgi:hypothetical protein
VLTVAAAEMEVHHTQKVEDFRKLGQDYLDEEIDFHEKVRFHSYSITSPPEQVYVTVDPHLLTGLTTSQGSPSKL